MRVCNILDNTRGSAPRLIYSIRHHKTTPFLTSTPGHLCWGHGAKPFTRANTPTMLFSLAVVAFHAFCGLALVTRADDCTKFPSWTIKDFKSNTSDSVGNTGTASFSLTNNLRNTTDQLSCKLEANYRCTIVGTPSDKKLTVDIAIRSAALTLALDEEIECTGKTSYVS